LLMFCNTSFLSNHRAIGKVSTKASKFISTL
jgi:hypothetical protein